ncbi:PREDICTED: uncharacterized protein LOC106820822 [Priapulus caudatus]|uniref:Uncharacterized protein LOC106820822 n=1 Tax=Priapulus caudatus TaxID=37621 RepID=A0ABM1F8V7_PRICU|nr:PREDICTED: uncharacterized protein LOC106820822 [Priapulus caudatus]
MPLCELCCVRRDGRWVDDEDVGKHCMMILTFVGAVLTCCGIICLLVGIFADFWPDENDIYPGYVYPYPLDTPEHIRNQMTKANGYAIICMGGELTVIGAITFCISQGYRVV